jgi:hypothetical protein
MQHRSWCLIGALIIASSSCGGTGSEPSGPRHVFVTSAAFAGNLGGLSGADAKCTAAAAAAGLGGSFVAWLSDATTSAKDRVTGPGPWLRVGTTSVVFADRASLITTGPLMPVIVTEAGVAATGGFAWTGTKTDGTKATGDNCNNWSAGGTGAMTGSITSTSQWTESGLFNNCSPSTMNRLYCFQV